MPLSHFHRHLKLGAKFNLLTISLILITAVVVGGYLVKSGIEQRRYAMEVYGRSIISIIAQNSEYALYTEDQAALEKLVEDLIKDPDVAYIAIYNTAKQPLLQRNGTEPLTTLEAFPLIVFKDNVPPLSTRVRNDEGELSHLDLIMPVHSMPEEETSNLFPGENHDNQILGYVRIGLTYSHLDKEILALVYKALLFTLGVVITGIILTVLSTSKIIAPIKNLANITHRISEGDLDQTVTVKSSDEISDLGVSFNKMLEKLRQYRDRTTADRQSLEDKVAERTAGLERAKENAQSLAKQAEEASMAKSHFLANMSHELRTPLNAILGYTQIFLGKQHQLSGDIVRGLSTIQKSGEHLLSMINDILDTAKIEAGKVTLSPTPVQFEQFLQNILEFTRSKSQLKGLQVKLETSPPLPTAVLVDTTRLTQILLNLLDNAINATENGSITLRVSSLGKTPPQRKGQPLPCHRLRFDIIDTGIGITDDQLSTLFTPFEQASEPEQQAKGTGLGLFISRQLVTLMGGDITVKSTPGQGSTFSFEINVEETQISSQIVSTEDQQITGYSGPMYKILIADDIASNGAFLADLLTPLGFEVIQAINGHQAVQLAQSDHPDLILMDRYMPKMDGLKAIMKIREIPYLQKIPAIAISASITDKDREQFLDLGFNDFLPKPVQWPLLSRLLQTHLKLNWQYEDKPKEEIDSLPEIEPPEPPPEKELRIICSLAQIGDIDAIIIRANHLERLDARYGPFANKLRHLAEDFDDRQIYTLAHQALERMR